MAEASSFEEANAYQIRRDQVACQNLADMTNFRQVAALGNHTRTALYVQLRDNLEHEKVGHACIVIPKGSAVSVRKSWTTLECVDIEGRLSSRCFYTEAVSKTRPSEASSWAYSSLRE